FIKIEAREDAPIGIDYPCNAVIGNADERQTLFDCPDARLMEMLVRASGEAEPAVIGDIDQRLWPSRRLDQCPGKNRFITNECADRRQSRNIEKRAGRLA